jgi:hypothetical protein
MVGLVALVSLVLKLQDVMGMSLDHARKLWWGQPELVALSSIILEL